MAKVSSKNFKIEKGTSADFNQGWLRAKGPKGDLSLKIKEGLTISLLGENLTIFGGEEKKNIFGLYCALIKNLLWGVAHGFRKELELVGVGFKVKKEGSNLILGLGFSHPVSFTIPEGVEVEIADETHLIITGASAQAVGQTAAQLRNLKKPEPYKGKGIKNVGEVVRRKAGKAAKATVAIK